MKITWPNGHKFAFSVVDDTDWATLERVKPIYDLLADLGLKTTKTVWMSSGNSNGSPKHVDTCQNQRYVDWLLRLQRQGFEIALHNAAPATSNRAVTQRDLDRFSQLFGCHDILFCNHSGCEENIYWGDARLSGWHRAIYNLVTWGKRKNISRGHVADDPLFWGDLCQKRVRYVRNFVFDEVNILSICPELPYHDPSRPFVNFWFPSTDGSDPKRFLSNLTISEFDRLATEGGACIAYVHFAKFTDHGVVNQEFRKRMEYVSSLNGWFVPASEILEHLRAGGSVEQRAISPQRLKQLERLWLFEKLFKGTS